MATTSIVDYLKSVGQDSSLSSRAKLAVDNGLVSSSSEYLNLAAQGKNADLNTQLLSKLQTKTTATPTPTTTKTQTNTASSASAFNNAKVTGSDLEKGSSVPEPTSFLDTVKKSTLNDTISGVATATFDSNKMEIDKLRSELQRITEGEKAQAQAKVDKYGKQVEEFVGTTQSQDALAAVNKKLKVEENLELYSDIQSKVVAAQEALNMGLIYEKDRPARMKFITGAESTLRQQGLATIGALQGTAAVIKGNIDLARSYADATIAAINKDNETSFKALTTLMDFANNELIDLTTREREIIDQRITSIETESTRMQDNKDKVLDLMTNYPKAFLAGGVTLLDSRESALQKMLPTMASDEKIKFENSLKKTSESTSKEDEKVFKAQLLGLKNGGMSYDEAVMGFGDVLSLDYIKEVYGKDVDEKTRIENEYYGKYDPTKQEIVLGTGGTPIIKDKAEEDKSVWDRIGGAWNSLFN